jgi:hypothetical protein
MTEPRDYDQDHDQDYDQREYGTVEKDLSSVVSQVQKLVDQYHDIRFEVSHLSEKIPENLDVRIIQMELQLKQIIDNLESQYVSQKEFERYKVEHAQMRYLMYGFIVMIMTSVVGAWLALIVHNAAAVVK